MPHIFWWEVLKIIRDFACCAWVLAKKGRVCLVSGKASSRAFSSLCARALGAKMALFFELLLAGSADQSPDHRT